MALKSQRKQNHAYSDGSFGTSSMLQQDKETTAVWQQKKFQDTIK